ncbi:MAG: hypothetical protein JW809_02210 [Pirellulales bacterium]|nr:hypothetical protein [Pirellulales bacterium]
MCVCRRLLLPVAFLAIVAAATANAWAVLVTYEIQYDPDTDETIVFNLAESQSALLLFPTVGANQYQQYWLDPGQTFRIKGGTVTSSPPSSAYHYYHFNMPESKFHCDWLADGGDVQIAVSDTDNWKDMEVCNVYPNGCYNVRWLQDAAKTSQEAFRIHPTTAPVHYDPDPLMGMFDVTGPEDDDYGYLTLFLGSSVTEVTYPWVISYPDYYALDQSIAGLISGRLRISTDTDDFLSVFTPNLATGCNQIPEPCGLLIWLSLAALSGLALGRARAAGRRVK